jgi:urocanate hydratase
VDVDLCIGSSGNGGGSYQTSQQHDLCRCLHGAIFLSLHRSGGVSMGINTGPADQVAVLREIYR